MMPLATLSSLERAARDLKSDFDQRFAERPAGEREKPQNLIVVRVGMQTYAIRLDEIRGLHRDTPVLELPSQVPAFIGVSRVGHTIAPTYELRILLGEPGTDRGTEFGADLGPAHEQRLERQTRWLVLAAGVAPVALAFEALERQLPARREDLLAANERSSSFLRGAVRDGADRHPLLHLPSLIQSLESHR